jgi:hypothetical protein
VPLHISTCESKIKKKSYCIGKSIILPHVRYVNSGGSHTMMFHSPVTQTNGQLYTSRCDKTDVSGLCLGHKMSRKEFLETYCNGVEPETRTNTE